MGLIAFPVAPLAPVEEILQKESSATLAVAEDPRLVRVDPFELTVKVTSYNAVPEQTDHNPFVTASGAFSNPEVVAARSVDLAGDLPFGTVVTLTREASDTENCRYQAVEHLIGYRVIADSMHSRKREQIDILLDQTHTVPVHGKETNPSIALGLCGEVTVTVIGKIAISDIPETQEELRLLVEGDSFARR